MSEPTGMRLGTGPLPPPTIEQLLTMSEEPIVKGPGPEWPDYDPAILEEQKAKVLRERMAPHERAEHDRLTEEARDRELQERIQRDNRELQERIQRDKEETRASFGDKAAILEGLGGIFYSGSFVILDIYFDGERIEKILEAAKACDCYLECEESEPYVEFTLTPRE